ncbi:MAG: hypothetical protein HYY48_11630 [Gammaproteobacteria bacterium]|nr:hypothetical protein [Gammaproteobacteria bacterium]
MANPHGLVAEANIGPTDPAFLPVINKVHEVYPVCIKQRIPIIGQGGITTAEDAIEFLIAAEGDCSGWQKSVTLPKLPAQPLQLRFQILCLRVIRDRLVPVTQGPRPISAMRERRADPVQ